MGNWNALANLDVDAAIRRLAEGAMLKQIAAEYGVDKSAVYRKLSKHPDYREAIALQAHTWVEDAMEEVMDCTADTVNIARARVDACFKYAKAHNPAYADKQTEGGAQIVVNIAPPEAVTGQAVRVELPAIEADGK